MESSRRSLTELGRVALAIAQTLLEANSKSNSVEDGAAGGAGLCFILPVLARLDD